jgi:CheY-like chemotaxis protein
MKDLSPFKKRTAVDPALSAWRRRNQRLIDDGQAVFDGVDQAGGRGRSKTSRGGAPYALIVDANRYVLNTVGRMVEVFGYHTVLAESGGAALAEASTRRLRIALVDLDAAVAGDGRLIQRIREIQPHLKVMAMTAWSPFNTLCTFGDICLVKPFGLEEIAQAIHRLGLPSVSPAKRREIETDNNPPVETGETVSDSRTYPSESHRL